VAILRDEARSATVRATAPTTLLTMDRETFRRIVADSLGTTEDFDRVLQRRLEGSGARA
jgi:CRP-like cAMP-binding protein